ncbi:sporulation protein YpjB [Alteribacillus persepolensis]|uniref:Sporulation protein YpjB n=1 Tax=Alteribacillus persepolensis TaxID=568899 RepID=A0A1G7ZEB2_9BACI|nr:sporulation protein YpjB [Alteribacillus persepolensis]SDH07014.1 sporulation protein YpjB [Alteribacillus persepolensis]
MIHYRSGSFFHKQLFIYGCLSAAMFFLFFCCVGQTSAEHAAVDMEEVNEKAALLYELAEKGNYEDAKQVHSWLKQHLPSVPFDEYDVNTNQLSELLRSFERAEEAVNRAELDDKQRLRYLFAFRLAADAVVSQENPLWKQSAKQLLHQLDELEQQVHNGEVEHAKQTFQEWQRQFEEIRPAIYTGVEEQHYLPFISYVRYMDQHAGWLQSTSTNDIQKLKTALENVVNEEKRSAADPSLWLVMLSVGSAIIVSLTYAGWRKYKGEKQRQQIRD